MRQYLLLGLISAANRIDFVKPGYVVGPAALTTIVSEEAEFGSCYRLGARIRGFERNSLRPWRCSTSSGELLFSLLFSVSLLVARLVTGVVILACDGVMEWHTVSHPVLERRWQWVTYPQPGEYFPPTLEGLLRCTVAKPSNV